MGFMFGPDTFSWSNPFSSQRNVFRAVKAFLLMKRAPIMRNLSPRAAVVADRELLHPSPARILSVAADYDPLTRVISTIMGSTTQSLTRESRRIGATHF